jgi:hypothetical protein
MKKNKKSSRINNYEPKYSPFVLDGKTNNLSPFLPQ